ncbi:MAG: ribonuclease J [Geminocystis sp.]|nr:ribonuclease J [Geminocystis sp.]HIK36723.1 ribonuclease J [Geminocystis sp. M7585_C2015_104]MCS7146803.1 ribonuclease J [Geminocystis sp.]MCX8077047.1 ribonuclease J [Geminocystis sp.]MDW8115629.1 ribonuclease J [Geminocystis sp.]
MEENRREVKVYAIKGRRSRKTVGLEKTNKILGETTPEITPVNPPEKKLKIIPLGGLHEIGKNTCIYEYDDEIILVDAGLGFPTEGMHGINIVLPDMTYLKENNHKIKAMIATHAHEDHIGGIPYHLKQIDLPLIYGPRLAISLLEEKLEEAGLLDKTKLHPVLPREVVSIGKYFKVEFIRNTHSIADSFTLAIHTPIGVLIHTGDYKIDHTPVDGERFDLHRLAELGEKGVLCLLGDSTNAEVPGFAPSEMAVYGPLESIFAKTRGRLFITTFSTSVHRLNIILSLAQKYNRKVGVVGRSMLNVIAHARNLGYIRCPDHLFQSLRHLSNLPDHEVLILCTGCQGEKLAAMTRIAKGEHPQVKIRPGDTVVFSANPIPGNTLAVVDTIDKLMLQGADVIYGRHLGIHVSGHGCQEDQKLMLALTKPKFFVPVHGEYRMLVKHAEIARSMGIPPENIVLVNNGETVELTPDSICKGEKVPSGIQLVDTAGVVHAHVMQERQQLAEDGVVTVAAVTDSEGNLLSPPQITLRGVVCTMELPTLERLISFTVERTIQDRIKSSLLLNAGEDINWNGIRLEVEANLSRVIQREIQSEPLVIFMLHVSEGRKTPETETDEEIEGKFPRRRRKTTATTTASV